LCTTHHDLLHDGKLTVTGNADHDLIFSDASGRPIAAVASFATHVGSSRNVAHGALSQPGGSLTPALRLLELMGRRGGWTMDALIESSGLLAREVAATLTWLELDGKVRSRSGAFEPM
jgi:predicted Rossmann fold nucleotide-binding protein DprA/Smf involved in DNA uptake